MVQLSTEITPERHASPRCPPCREHHVHKKQNAHDACRTYPKSDEQRNTDKQLDNANNISEKYRMRQNNRRQHRPVKAHDTVRNVVLQIGLETTVRKLRPSHL